MNKKDEHQFGFFFHHPEHREGSSKKFKVHGAARIERSRSELTT